MNILDTIKFVKQLFCVFGCMRSHQVSVTLVGSLILYLLKLCIFVIIALIPILNKLTNVKCIRGIFMMQHLPNIYMTFLCSSIKTNILPETEICYELRFLCHTMETPTGSSRSAERMLMFQILLYSCAHVKLQRHLGDFKERKVK